MTEKRGSHKVLKKFGTELVLGLLETTIAGVGDEIQLTDALDGLLKLDGLNTFETDVGVFNCGNKRGFISANLAVVM